MTEQSGQASRHEGQRSRRGWCWAVVVAMVSAVALVLVGPAASAQAALNVTVINTDNIGVASRPGPHLSPTNGYGAPANASVTAACWTRGDAVGPYNNTIWWKVTYDGRQFFVADRYLSTPYVATDTPREPQCDSGGTVVSAPAPAATNVWVGSPFTGTWSPAGGYSHPEGGEGYRPHHDLYNNRVDDRDWSVDLGAPTSTAVYLYAAPAQSNQYVRAMVEQISPTCRNGRGGKLVRVSFYNNAGVRIGSATYGHINPTVGLGEVPRWGTKLGTVGSYPDANTDANNPCWEGAHLHFEMFSVKNYACWNKGYGHQYGYRLNPTNFLGFTGPGKAYGPFESCP